MGIASNNEAEYMAVVHALQHAMSLRPHTGEIVVYSDSKLVVGQLSLGWRVKASNLIPLHIMARDFDRMMGCPVRYVHIPREQNKGADSIVNRVLDEQEAELNGSNDDC